MRPRRLAHPVLLGLLALPFSAAMAMAMSQPAAAPSLILPGDRVVRAGQLIALHWAPIDSVSELEILLSVDGGHHYSLCISPQLDPARCDYVWRVPDLGRARLRLRIRFNRGGREIEGPPSAPLRLAIDRSDQPEPLGLPPLDDAAGADGARPGRSRSELPAAGPASGLIESSDECADSRHASSKLDAAQASTRTPAPTALLLALDGRPPRSFPLRA